MIKCVYCNRPAVSEKTEAYELKGVRYEHTFSHCESCKEDFVTPQQRQLNEERRSTP